MKSVRFPSALAGSLLLLSAVVPAHAAMSFSYGGDAGQTLGTAVLVNTQPGGTDLSDISAALLTNSNADLFKIFLPAGTFTATTDGSFDFDTVLYLFDSTGHGVAANDDDGTLPPDSTLTVVIAAPDVYYLGIAAAGYFPASNTPASPAGYIFPVTGGILGVGTPGDTSQFGPTGPGGANPLTDWVGVTSESGSYDIILTGAQFLPSAVPEPGTWLLMAGGLLALFVWRRRVLRKIPARVAIVIGAAGIAGAQTPNMDASLQQLVALQKASPISTVQSLQAPVPQVDGGPGVALAPVSLANVDSQGRVLVDVALNAGTTPAVFEAYIAQLGGAVKTSDMNYRNGVYSVYISLLSADALGQYSGTSSLSLALKPKVNVGSVTSQGTVVMHSDTVNAGGITGSGVTVGVMSDSFDTNTGVTIHAANDIASGDLPTPKFVIDSAGGTDEGRAMAQIVYDVAPGSSICFATANATQTDFANNIRTLRTNPSCLADVIVDDVFYFAEPVFSDGQVAKAVNDVVTSNVLAGKKVAYFSSAGNQNGGSFNATSPNFIAPGSVSATDLTLTAAALASCGGTITGSFLDFGGGKPYAAVTIVGTNTSPAEMTVQWDDPFNAGAITTDYDVYFFNSTGASCVLKVGGNNFTTDQPFEFIGLNTGGGTFSGRMAVVRTTAGTHLASRIRLTQFGGFGGAIFTSGSPTTFGHSAASNAISVAAYRYSTVLGPPYSPAFESFSSPGPVVIAFDGSSNRYIVPETRKKPDVAAPDGVNTTFFFPGDDYEGDGIPNFFGTSAAAPHAAGVAALMLQKKPTLTAAQIRTILQGTAPARLIPGTATTGKGFSAFDGYGLIDALAAINAVH